jgi:hypothetical protein
MIRALSLLPVLAFALAVSWAVLSLLGHASEKLETATKNLVTIETK